MSTTTCKLCGKRRDKDNMQRYNNHYFCDEACIAAFKKQSADRIALTDYIQYLYGTFPTKVTKQMEEYKKQGMTYKGQELSLRYWYDTLEHEFNAEQGIGIIPYIYDDAKRFFLDKQRVARCANDMQEDKVVRVGKNKNVALMKYKLRRSKDEQVLSDQ